MATTDRPAHARAGDEGAAKAPTIRIADDLDLLSVNAAGVLADLLRDTVAERGRASLALAGGSTPKATYHRLATEAGRSIPWPSLDIVFGDERAVPPDHAESNYRMAREALLDRVAVAPERVHRMRGELPVVEGAAEYEAAMRALFAEGAADDARPLVDVCLLGVGDDGHTASLFPGARTLAIRDRWAAAAEAPPTSPIHDRITLTLPMLSRSRVVCFLVAGAGKAEILRRILVDEEPLPAGLVRGVEETYWMMDRGAARRL